MTVVGVTMVKDEADIIGFTLAHMVNQVDAIVIADNMSSDGTRDIIEDVLRTAEYTLITDDDPAYYQSRKMSWLAAKAYANHGADWVVPFDADEVWYAPTAGSVAEHLSKQPDHIAIVEAALYDHVASSQDDLSDPNPIRRIQWRRRPPLELRKVACRPIRPVTIDQGNHDARYVAERGGDLAVRHFPYRSPEQFISKSRNGAAAYAATDLPESRGAHWRNYGKLIETFGEEQVKEEVFRQWFYSADPRHDPLMVYDPAPATW